MSDAPPEGTATTTADPASAGSTGQAPDPTAAVQHNGAGSSDHDRQGQEPADAERSDLSADQMRQELARVRREAAGLRGRLRQFEDRDKSEQQRLSERAEEAEQAVAAAHVERDAALADRDRFLVAADMGLDLKLARRLQGKDRKELEADAEALKEELGTATARTGPRPAAAYDGGVRQTPDQKGTPEDEHAKLILGLTGRLPNST